MPISKTCYFCKPVGKKECDACTNVTKSNFVGNADWLYIEGLHQRIIELEIGEKLIEKENESLKKENEELKAKLDDAEDGLRMFYGGKK